MSVTANAVALLRRAMRRRERYGRTALHKLERDTLLAIAEQVAQPRAQALSQGMTVEVWVCPVCRHVQDRPAKDCANPSCPTATLRRIARSISTARPA